VLLMVETSRFTPGIYRPAGCVLGETARQRT